jgi:hypothetical protein
MRADPAGRLAQLVRLAALREPDPQYWHGRFGQLVDTGVLTLSLAPERQVCLRAREAVAPPAQYWRQQLTAHYAAGRCISIDLTRVLRGHVARTLQPLLDTLVALQAENRARGNVERAAVLLSLPLDSAALPAVLALRDAAPEHSRPRLAVLYGAADEPGQLPAWRLLSARSHADAGLVPAPARAVRPLSPLHAGEPGQVLLGHSLCAVAADTAWLTLDLDARALQGAGSIRRCLATCLRLADNLIDVLNWPTAALQLDALLNRRVGINITHVGDRLVQQQLDPRRADTFAQLRRWLLYIRRCFVHESARLARLRGPFPELRPGELINSLTPLYGVADAQRLVRNRILRHRHLLMLSPFAVLPAVEHTCSLRHYINLLPVLGCADVISMRGPDVRDRLSLKAWTGLLQLTGAIASNNVISPSVGDY